MPSELIVNDDEKFKSWCRQHPEGFVINTNLKPRKGYLVLHKVGCRTFKPPYTTTTYSKIVGSTLEALEEWVQKRFGTGTGITQRTCSCLRKVGLYRKRTMEDHVAWDFTGTAVLTEALDLENGDQREIALLAVRLRRGQSTFRESLIKAYGPKCMITGCDLLAVVEAAHIKPFRGIKDHKVENGLLLRADIHTLFDLNLLAVSPDSLCVRTHRQLKGTIYEELNEKPLLLPSKCQLSKEALKSRWKEFET